MTSSLVRVRHALPLGILAAVGIVGFYAPVKTGIDQRALPQGSLLAGAACWFVVGVALRARAWRILDTPVSKVRAATVGVCEFAGIARAPAPLVAPGSGVACAWFRWELQHYVSAGRSSHWKTVDRTTSVQTFSLTDGTGSISVQPEQADFEGLRTFTMPAPGRGRRWRQREWRIPDEGPVSVLGPVQAVGDTLVVGAAAENDDDFIISDDSKQTLARRFGWWAWLSLTLGAIAAVAAPIVVTTHTTDASSGKTNVFFALRGSGRLALALALVYVLLLWVSWLARVYNRLVIVRYQAEKAWSSIEVQLQRRHDLIDGLVTVVQKYQQYERQTLVDMAGARTRGALPTTPEIEDVSAQNAAAHGEAAQLVALAESNPQLHADEEFAKLSAALTDTENRVALARQFYNDAVTVLRDRRSTFPYLLVARLVSIPSFELFQGGDAAPVRVYVGAKH